MAQVVQIQTITCSRCKESFIPRVPKPVKCPRCQKPLNPKKKKAK